MNRTCLLAALFALLWAIACRAPAPDAGHTYGALGSIYPPPSWAVANWYVDPANSTAAASDNNTCTTSGAPCLTWKEIIRRYGTYEPILRQSTTVTWLSSPSDDSDPFIWRPVFGHGAGIIVKGTIGASQQVATGTISSLTAKNRSTPQLLQATFPAGVAANQLVFNSTHSSHAWTYAQVSGNTYSVSQPLAPYVPLQTTVSPTEVDTWANTDTVTLYNPVTVNVRELRPRALGIDGTFATFNEFVALYQLNINDPSGNGTVAVLGTNVQLIDCIVTTGIRWEPSLDAGIFAGLPNVNDNFRNSLAGGGEPYLPTGDARFLLYGGIANFAPNVHNAYIDYDIILVGGALQYGGDIGAAYVASGATYYVAASTTFQRHKGPGNFLWGPGGLDVMNTARLSYPSGANQAAASLLLTGAIQINTGSVACSIGTGASAVVNCGISPTAAHLDAAVGASGFGGVAFVPGGASITNLSP